MLYNFHPQLMTVFFNRSADRESDMDVCEPEFDYDQELEIMRTIETELLEEECKYSSLNEHGLEKCI